MAAGTLSVTNNSTAVVGTGTAFTALKAGDFLSLVVGQVPYTVAIASVESDTALTLVLPFDGPTATELAWDGVARDTMSLATMGVTVQAQKALRLMIADENNWRAIFGDAEEITVTLPNGQVMQGMSWGYLSSLLKDPAAARDHLGIGPDDTLTLGNLVTTGAVVAGRNSWDGSNWGSQSLFGAAVTLAPDGITTPGLYVRKSNGDIGYASNWLFYENAGAWATESRIVGYQFCSPKGSIGYNQLWSEAILRADPYTAPNGVESYKSLAAGAAVTQGIGFAGGVSFGMMTTGGNNWPRAQISIGTADRDAAGNMASQTHFRFDGDGQISYAGPLGAGTFQQVPASDRNLKHDIEDDSSRAAYDNIKALRFRTFVFNNDEQKRQRRGIIAQEAEEIDPLYVKHRVYSSHELNGPLVHQLELDPTPLLLDTMRALQDTMKQVEDLKAEIAALKK